MKSEDMILKAAIVHILDSSVGIPVLSDQSMEVGPDFSDFLKAHIEKITESDDVKHCTFAEGSEVKELLQNCTPDNFVETSKQLAERLYDIMNANIDIPAADVAMTVFGCKGKDYLHASDQGNGRRQQQRDHFTARTASGTGTAPLRGVCPRSLRRLPDSG